jgi:hypothetical protein
MLAGFMNVKTVTHLHLVRVLTPPIDAIAAKSILSFILEKGIEKACISLERKFLSGDDK